MDLLRKYLMNSTVAYAPPDRAAGVPARGRVSDAVQDDGEPYEPDAAGDDTADVEAAAGEDDGDYVEGDEDDGADDIDPEPEPERRPRSRGQQRIENLSTTNRELRAQVAASEARLAALEAQMNAPRQAAQPTREEEEARLALMSPEERMNYRLENTIRQNNAATAGALAAVRDQTDRAEFRALLRDKPQWKKFEADVERKFQELTKKGTPIPREAVLVYVIGEAAYKTTEQPRRRSQSQERIRQQETRPGSAARGDVRGDRRQANSGASGVERRLANINI